MIQQMLSFWITFVEAFAQWKYPLQLTDLLKCTWYDMEQITNHLRNQTPRHLLHHLRPPRAILAQPVQNLLDLHLVVILITMIYEIKTFEVQVWNKVNGKEQMRRNQRHLFRSGCLMDQKSLRDSTTVTPFAT